MWSNDSNGSCACKHGRLQLLSWADLPCFCEENGNLQIPAILAGRNNLQRREEVRPSRFGFIFEVVEMLSFSPDRVGKNMLSAILRRAPSHSQNLESLPLGVGPALQEHYSVAPSLTCQFKLLVGAIPSNIITTCQSFIHIDNKQQRTPPAQPSVD